MEQKQKNIVSIDEEVYLKTVDLFINSDLLSLTGNWEWEMHSESVFCSDVIMALPADYIGTKGIIHPDDLESVKQQLLLLDDLEFIDLNFRMITTYNEVKNISGNNISKTEIDELKLQSPVTELITNTANQVEFEKGFQLYQNLKQTSDFAETLTKTATWFTNTNTNETCYSDNVFRMYALSPQSLNPHLHTFTTFIHPDDADAVNEAFDAAYKNAVPICLQYRIITANGIEKFISLTTNWCNNFKGELILNGLLQDLTETKAAQEKIEQVQNDVQLQKSLLQFNEVAGNTGYWQMNLLTRQTFYSDNYYRIHGLKPQSIPAAAGIFNNYIHSDDREKVIQAFKKIQKEHIAPDIEYCIIRADGKLRHVILKGQLVSHGDELVMTGIIKDVTQQKTTEQELQDQYDNSFIKSIAYAETEQVAGISSWVQDMQTGNIFWSDNMYNLLGVRKQVKELTFEQLVKAVLPEDRRKFTDEVAIAKEGAEREVKFSILRIGGVRNIKGVFKVTTADDRKFFTGALQDVTDRQSLEQQLYEGLQLNELLTQNILDSVFITDINNKIILWNRKCEQVFNLKKEDVLQRNYFDVFNDNKTETVINRFNTVLKGDRIHEPYERLFQKKFYDLNMMPLRDRDYKVIGILHVLHEVTGELQLRNSLSDRLHFIEKVMEETVDRIIVLDRNFNYTYWNKKAEEHYHINKEYAIGKNLLEIFPGMVNRPLYQKFKRALKGETVYIGSNKPENWEWKNETEQWEGEYIETYLIPLMNERKEVTGILWIVHDLTKEVLLQKKETEASRQIKRNKELLQSVFDASLHGIILLKAVRDAKGEIKDYEVMLNNAVTQSWNGKDMTGRLFAEEFSHIKEQGLFDAYNTVLSTGEPMKMEIQNEAEGFKKWFTISAVKVNEDEVVSTAEDITDRKKAEEELIKNREKLLQQDITHKADEKLLEKKDEFISVASHELRGPVANVKLSIHILKELIEEVTEKQVMSDVIERADRQVNKLTNLINDLLDVTQLQQGNLTLKTSKFNLRAAIQETKKEISSYIKGYDIKIIGDEVEVTADQNRLQQVITNFLSNAIKYSPTQKNINIKIETNGNIKVSVTDSGIGIPENALPHVFDRYYRVGEAANKFSGLGLGLYISKEIIKKHGGEIGVNSIEGQGSTFWFTLPL